METESGDPQSSQHEATNTQLPPEYKPINMHWFSRNDVSGKWEPFSKVDSAALEEAHNSVELSSDTVVATDGGRYDVNVVNRERNCVYWKAPTTEVRRCSWFRRGSADGVFVPYEEYMALVLENQYQIASQTNQWNREVELPNGDRVVFHAPDVLVLFPPTYSPDNWANTNQSGPRPRMIRRGIDEFGIEEGEPKQVDHLLFLVHGIGPVCDLKFQSVQEVVNQFRTLSHQLLTSHYSSSCESGVVNRMEVLPISWHSRLHSTETGIDERLKSITLESIPAVRRIANTTLSDVLFYTSPAYCQLIISTVASELNRLYELFRQRNPTFQGAVSVGGHSLGSLILFDLLSHQHSQQNPEDAESLPQRPSPGRRISIMMPNIGPGPANVTYPHLKFEPSAFFALGSPIGFFITVRGIESLGEDFAFPTCPAFFNVFHPFDPVAYRIEAFINPALGKLKPVLVPHHKGRKRIHLEVKDTYQRLTTDIKQRLLDSLKSPWNPLYFLGMNETNNSKSIEEVVEEKFSEQINSDPDEHASCSSTVCSGILNKGRRIDYVLQETPMEFVNQYLTAVTSHVCYWDSSDTVLLMVKEIYNTMGILCDEQVPQQSMTIERPVPQEAQPSRLQTLRENISEFGPSFIGRTK